MMTHSISAKKFAESRKSDPNGYERIIGESDLLSINSLIAVAAPLMRCAG